MTTPAKEDQSAPGETGAQANEERQTAGFTVYVDDNYHYMDEDERWTLGVFETADEAVAAAKDLVTKSVRHMHEAGMNAEQVFARYQMFGDDPFIIRPGSVGRLFHAWDFARAESVRLFGTP